MATITRDSWIQFENGIRLKLAQMQLEYVGTLTPPPPMGISRISGAPIEVVGGSPIQSITEGGMVWFENLATVQI